MNLTRLPKYLILALIPLFHLSPAVADGEPAAFKKTGYVESDVGYSYITNNFQNWFDEYLKGYTQITPDDGMNWEFSHQSHFGQQGYLGSLGYKRIINDDWYGSISASTSSGGSFLPRYRADATLYRKWLDKRNLVTGVGFTYNQSRLANYDRIILIDILYYFDSPWILEIGGRIVESNPGAIQSGRGFMAITYGTTKDSYLTLRYDQGTEGWQAVGSSQTITNFGSYEATLLWRKWITRDFGFSFTANHYANPNYNRTGVIAGIFVDF